MPHRRNHVALAELLRLKEADRNESTSSIIQGVLDGLREHLSMDVAFISEFLDGKRVFRYVSCATKQAPIEVGGSDPLVDSYCHHIVEGRLPELIQNAAAIPFAAAMPVTKELPVGAHLSVPLKLRDGTTYGTMCCFAYEADFNLNRRNLDVLKMAAKLTGDLIDRRAMQESRQKELSAKITKAIEVGHYTTVYQPIYSIADLKPVGVEALVRFPDAEERSPSDWFDEADEVGLTVELEIATIQRALKGLTYLPQNVYLSVNVSLETLLSGELKAAFEGLSSNRVVIELTEHEAVEDYKELNQRIEELHGCAQLAIDDVGAGYSSMRHILDLGPDIIKLDVSMVRDIHNRPARSAFVKAMVQFARTLGSSIVAEGVELKEELDELARLGVAKAQGYLLCRPMPLLNVVEHLSCDVASSREELSHSNQNNAAGHATEERGWPRSKARRNF